MKKKTNNCIMISGGGTGGHIFPALAIANAIKQKWPNIDIIFVGSKNKMEMKIVPQSGYKIYALNISGFNRQKLLKNFALPFKILGSLVKSYKLLKKYKPMLCIGVGGYASASLLYVAGHLKIPYILQEQNNFPGITNKILAPKAHKICVAYTDLEKYFNKDKIVMTGNPIREIFINQDWSLLKKKAIDLWKLNPDLPTIFITGGSLGAKSINQAIENGINKINESNIQIIWQCGQSFESSCQPQYGFRTAFIKEMELAYAMADLVISRAGALSISELTVVGKPAILVPSPNVAEDHQTKNAMALVNINAAKMVLDSEAENKLVDLAIETITDKELLAEMHNKLKLLAKPNATELIVEEIEKIIS